ncbi:hypothetical protein FOA52_001623 [Chlamydomonas sp. UWO 241]|jgi:hypothetical protein|nr:hypothetical protein FOA52_001623 [Chlamydomonas sp. UWO 241]
MSEPYFVPQTNPVPSARVTGGGMKETDSSFTVKSSSFGITGGRYIHANMNRAAVKAARQLFFKAQKARPSSADNRVVEFQLVDITKGKGSSRSKPAFYRVTRTKKEKSETMQWTTGNKIVSLWTYKAERIPSGETTTDNRV